MTRWQPDHIQLPGLLRPFDCNELTFLAAPVAAPWGHPVNKSDIEEHFSTHGSGKITEIKLMNGFGFIEYEDAMDARDVVPGMLCWPLYRCQSLANHFLF